MREYFRINILIEIPTPSSLNQLDVLMQYVDWTLAKMVEFVMAEG